ncbi:MAG: ATP-binding protein [Deferrisomatales bacterium]|nr:ATP-binding protein [Deferrisomatales bacterium]
MRITLFPRLLFAFIVLSLPPLLWLSVDAARRIGEVGEEAVARSTRALDDKARRALELQAAGLAVEISGFLEERVQDLRILSELPKTPEVLFLFSRSRTGEVWKRRRGAQGIEDYRVRVPIYAEAAWVDPDGWESYRVDGDWMAPSRDLREVSDPTHTTFGVEDYFAAALERPPGEAYVGRLVGRHVGKAEQLAGASTPEEAVGGREYVGHLRFALAVREAGVLKGVLVLALDHVHLMEFSQHVLPFSAERVVFPSYLSGNYAFLFDDQGWIITHPKYWDIRGLDAQGRWVPAYSAESTPADVAAGRIPFNLDRAGFIHPNYPLVAEAVRRGESGVTQTFNVAGVGKVMAYAPIRFSHGEYRGLGVFGGVTVGALTEVFHREALETGEAIQAASTETLHTGILLAWLLGLAVLAAAFGLSRAVARPVRGMAAMAARIAAGDLSVRARLRRTDEVGDLGAALDRMAGLLEEKEGSLRDSLRELEDSRDAARAQARQLEEQLDILNQIQRISGFLGSTFDREEVLHIILETCVTGLGFDRAALFLRDGGGKQLHCLAANGFTARAEVELRGKVLPLDEECWVPVQVVNRGQGVQVAGTPDEPPLGELDRFLLRGGGSALLVCMPMKIRDAVVGALVADSNVRGGPVSPARSGALQIVAGQAARAIERARLYEEANQARAFIEAVVDSLASGLITLGSGGVVLTVNPYAERTLGLQEPSARGRTLDACGVDPSLAHWVRTLGEQGGQEAVEFEIETPGGRRAFTWVPSRFEAEGGQGLIVQFRDVTEDRGMNRALERVDRLASLGRMAAGVAHEIRNPLTGVALLLDDLHDRLPPGEDRALAARALQEIERLEGIVQELLAYARVDRMERRACRLEDVLEQSLFLLKKQALNQGVRVVFRTEPGLPRVQGDPEKLKQALLNLYLNALQAMPDGGELRLSARPKGAGAEVRVEDTGPGIPPAEAERIFEPFYTLRPGGTGLGLSIAHTIVSDHGGRLEVASSSGRGATFILTLPAASEEGTGTPASAAAPGPSQV